MASSTEPTSSAAGLTNLSAPTEVQESLHGKAEKQLNAVSALTRQNVTSAKQALTAWLATRFDAPGTDEESNARNRLRNSFKALEVSALSEDNHKGFQDLEKEYTKTVQILGAYSVVDFTKDRIKFLAEEAQKSFS